MALLMGRFMHYFPAYQLIDVFKMPASQFFLLNRKIRQLVAEEEARALSVAHHSKPGERMRELFKEMATSPVHHAGPSSEIIIAKDAETGLGFVRRAQPGDIEAMRARQRASTQEIEQDREAWLEKTKAKLALERSV